MSRDPREEVIEFVRENPEVSAPALALRFPGIDIWTLKTIRREVAREGSIAERPMDTVVESAALGLTKSAQAILKSGLLRPVTLALTERPKVKPIFKKAGTVVMVINDLHAPDVDWDALDVTLQIAMSLGIDRLIINGDGFDVHSLSLSLIHI